MMKVFWPDHWYHPTHGPQVWPWWRLVSISWVKAAVALPSTGRHLWVYTRRGAFMFGFYRLAPRPYDPNDVAWWNWP